MAIDIASIENLIATNFSRHQKSLDFDEEAFQRCRNDAHDGNPISTNESSSFATSESLRRQILDHVQKSENDSTEMGAMQIDIASHLEYMMGVTLGSIVQQKSTTLASFKSSPIYDSSRMILDLVSHFVCSKGDGYLAHEAVKFMGKFAAVDLECVRAMVCEFMGWCIHYLYGGGNGARAAANVNSRKVNVQFLLGYSSKEEEFEWREECTTAVKSFLIDRLQDKSQAVRQAAIDACGNLYVNHSLGPGQENRDVTKDLDLFNPELHEDITQALLWNMAHDPSFANRSMALHSVPIVIDTIPAIVERVRDSKLKVRVDALEVLTKKVSIHQLSNEQRANILRDGLSTRYPSTYVATTKMLCCGWMKSTKFDPIALLDLLDPVQHENVCLNAAKAIIATASQDYEMEGVSTTSDVTLAELSSPEIRVYKEKVLGNISITNPNALSSDGANGEEERNIDPANMIYIRARCELIMESKTMNEYNKSTSLAAIIPDVTILGDIIGKHIRTLNEIVDEKNIVTEQNGHDDDFDEDIMAGYDQKEDIEVFVCLHLLHLSEFVDLKEEGSRRHFSSTVHRILCNPDTHADLVEGIVQALSASNHNEASFLLSISEILASIIDADIDADPGELNNPTKEEKREQYLRAIEILSVALEKTSRKMSSNQILRNFNSIILNTITTPELGPLVREAGVSCLGRYVILMDEDTIIDTFKPVLMGIAFGEDEKIEIRAQAMLAISDLAFMFHRIMAPMSIENICEKEMTVTDLLLKMLSQSKKSLAIVAAECAAKLLFTGKIHDANIVAHLVTMYFDKNLTFDAEEEDDAVKEVGSPTRLAQLLTIFFPAYSMGSAIGRDNLTASISPLLHIVNNRMSVKRRGCKVSALPIAKMIEYLCQTIENGEHSAYNSSEKGSSPVLNAAVSICDFLCGQNELLPTSYVRSLCKILSKSYIDIDSEDSKSLQHLKRGLDELSMNITDDTAIGSLEVLIEILDEVPCDGKNDVKRVESEEEEDDDEEESILDERIEQGRKTDSDCSVDASETNQRKNFVEQKDDSTLPFFAQRGSTLAASRSTIWDSRNHNLSLLSPFSANKGIEESPPTRKLPRRGSRKEEIPLFASIGSNNRGSGRDSSEFESEPDDEISSSSFESDYSD